MTPERCPYSPECVEGEFSDVLSSLNLGPSVLARIAYFHVLDEPVSDAVDVLHRTVKERTAFSTEPDGRILVEVHQRVLDKDGGTLLDGRMHHIYSIRDGLVRHMEIRDPSEDTRFQVP